MAKLTEKQEKFAFLIGAEGHKKNAAYRGAFNAANMSEHTVNNQASKLAGRPDIAARIDEHVKSRHAAASEGVAFTVKRLMETYVAIALVDPNELISQRVGACRHCWGIDGGYQWKEREYMAAVAKWEVAEEKRRPQDPPIHMPDPAGGFGYLFTREPNVECVECEGEGVWRVVPMDTRKLSPGAKHLYRGVQQTKDGVKVLFANQDKALENIGRMLGAFDDKLRVDLEGKIASLKLTTSDPKEAADAYARMISGGT